MFKALAIAFSTYSRVPMPKVEWDEKSMRYSMCFFPVVGAVEGVLFICIYKLMSYFAVSVSLMAVVATIFPIVYTGGIHIDGFMDTIDARKSYKPREEKLRILKDPHAGAFAIIYCVVYQLLTYGLYYQIFEKLTLSNAMSVCDVPLKLYLVTFYIAAGFVISRTLSGLSVVTFKKAKNDGMVADISKAQHKKTAVVLGIFGIALAGLLLYLNIILGAAVLIAAAVAFVYYRLMSYKIFGGVTGDLAGYFLSLCELFILMAICVCLLWWV